ncbi:MAG: type II secretion system F family protein [Elusimicrobia bacterium]|nr:type II secretion system F family protein [Elusimicrobiota bacterium]
MPTFAYKVKGTDGAVTSGTIDAPQQRAAVEKLRAQKLTVLEINEAGGGLIAGIKSKLGLKPKVGSKDLVIFSRQLSTLVSAGVPIVQGLTILEEQMENPTFRRVVGDVRTDIESGLSISDGLRKHPEAFPEIYTAMIKAGELGGILDTILERLSGFLEASENLKAKVKSAMMYPAIVLSICGLVTIFLLTFVIPTFKTIFESFGRALPYPTQVLINISDTLRTRWYMLFIIPVAIWQGFKYFYKTSGGKKWVDGHVLKAPVFGILLKKVAVAKFTRTLGTLIKSGVPIMQGLETVAATAGNVVIEEAVMATRESIREGGRLADPLKKSGLFPPMVTQMISVGEETGSLDTMLIKIADFYDAEVDTAVKGLTSMIEPIVIVIMGTVVGAIVIAMFMPMFEMGSMAG